MYHKIRKQGLGYIKTKRETTWSLSCVYARVYTDFSEGCQSLTGKLLNQNLRSLLLQKMSVPEDIVRDI